jgi:pimeloyl-ACP methyl ester carboxylesterase
MWDPQVEAMAARHRVLRYDLRGFGDSSLPVASYSHCEDLGAFLRGEEIEQPVIVGLSLGANTALEFAYDNPGLVRGLVLASPGLPGHGWKGEHPPTAAAEIAAADGIEAAKRYWLTHPIYASLRDGAAFDALGKMVNKYHGWHWQNADPRRPAPDLASRLADISVPALVVSGGRDAAEYQSIARSIAGALPNGQLARLARAGHALNLDEPHEFTRLVLAFVAGLTTSRPLDREFA